MSTINVELSLGRKVEIEVRLDDVIDSIRSCDVKKRWNYIAGMLNDVEADISELTEEQKEIIKNWLNNKLSLF